MQLPLFLLLFAYELSLCQSSALNYVDQPPPDLDLAQQFPEVPNALIDVVPSQPSISDYFSYQVYEAPTPEPDHRINGLRPTTAPEISWYSLDPTDPEHQQQEICCNQQSFQPPSSPVQLIPPTIVHEPQLITPPDQTNQIPGVQDEVRLELMDRVERLDRLQNRLSRLRRRSRRLQLDLMWMEKRSRERRLYFFDTLWRMTYRQLSSIQDRIDRIDHQALRFRTRLKGAVRRSMSDWQRAKLLRESDLFVDRQNTFVQDQHKKLRRVKPILRDFQLQYHLEDDLPVYQQQNEIQF